jgi:hypothetical protein
MLADKRLLSSVYSHVPRQVALVARAEVAVLADKRLLSTVQPQVPRQVALVARAVVAVLADKRLLPSVYSHVPRQVALLGKSRVAVLADKRLLPSVQPQVPRQVALVARAVVAMSTLKGLLPTVQPQVPRQVALLGGLIPTVLALVDHHLAPRYLGEGIVINRNVGIFLNLLKHKAILSLAPREERGRQCQARTISGLLFGHCAWLGTGWLNAVMYMQAALQKAKQ